MGRTATVDGQIARGQTRRSLTGQQQADQRHRSNCSEAVIVELADLSSAGSYAAVKGTTESRRAFDYLDQFTRRPRPLLLS